MSDFILLNITSYIVNYFGYFNSDILASMNIIFLVWLQGFFFFFHFLGFFILQGSNAYFLFNQNKRREITNIGGLGQRQKILVKRKKVQSKQKFKTLRKRTCL